MARSQRISVRRNLQELIPNSLAMDLAARTGFVKRERKLELPAFAWSLALGFGSGGRRTISSLHDTYLTVARKGMNESSFGDHLRKPEFVDYAKGLVEHAITKVDASEDWEGTKLGGDLAQFKELLCADSSLVRLHWSLQDAFPGTRTNHSPASLKVHLVQKVHGSGVKRIKITEGRRADARTLPVDESIRDNLLLIDLGYYDFAKFSRIDALGGYFISRVKAGANPTIVRSLLNHRGNSVDVENARLQDVLPRFRRQVIDLQVRVRFQTRVYKGKRQYKEQILRLVGVWNDDEARYHLYFTNLSPEQLGAESVAEAYRLRWHVELFFRQLKTIHGMGETRVMNEFASVGLVYMAILSLLATRQLIHALEERFGLTPAELCFEHAAGVVQHHALFILRIIVRPPRDFGRLELETERTLIRKMPNRNASCRQSLRSKTMYL